MGIFLKIYMAKTHMGLQKEEYLVKEGPCTHKYMS